jgi:putative peptide zinc metalloprotease protein
MMTAPEPNPAKKPVPLPRLREDLSLMQGASSDGTRPAWLIYDPLRHKYTQIDQSTFAILSLWKTAATVEELISTAEQTLGLWVSEDEIMKLGAFLEQHQLTEPAAAHTWKGLEKRSRKHRHGMIMWLVHNYLFLKVPLVAPEPFLRATQHFVAPFFTKHVQAAIAALGVIGLYLVSREWDSFLLEARGLATLTGVASIAAVLFVVKAFHEFGHAYTAIRYGCRVPSMGLAVMMMAPMLYTDVTDAWRLQDRKQRLAIDAAGVSVELGLACLATLLWAFLPDGMLRHVAFLVATTSWIMSIAINLNPFMKFDGYYMLGDMLRIDNLMPRSFEFGVWYLREVLFGLNARPPEVLPADKQRFLVVYAYAVWFYRVILFTGIAMLVYSYFFKALGLALFLFEIGYFLAKPLASELTEWWKLRAKIVASRRLRMTATAVGLAALVCLVPWSSRVTMTAMLEGDELVRIFPPRPAQIISVSAKPGDWVAEGQVLAVLQSPELAQKQRVAKAKLAAVTVRLNRLVADGDDRNARQVLESERAALSEQLAGLARQTAELTITAPKAGVITEFDLLMRAGQWISPKQQIALLDASMSTRVIAYVSEHDVSRLTPGAAGRFYPEAPLAANVHVILAEIASSAATEITIPELVAPNGGAIEAYPDAQQRLIPVVAQYHLTLRPPADAARPASAMRGVVYLNGQSESLLGGAWRRVVKVLIRESGV